MSPFLKRNKLDYIHSTFESLQRPDTFSLYFLEPVRKRGEKHAEANSGWSWTIQRAEVRFICESEESQIQRGS